MESALLVFTLLAVVVATVAISIMLARWIFRINDIVDKLDNIVNLLAGKNGEIK